MKLFVGSDHAGFSLKQKVISSLSSDHDLEDMGTHSEESCDYPDYAYQVAESVLKNKDSRGILICGTGLGMCMAANKVKGIRAASVSEKFSAKMAREHNDAQILCIGSRVLEAKQAIEIINEFLGSSFDTSNPRHQRRIDKIAAREEESDK